MYVCMYVCMYIHTSSGTWPACLETGVQHVCSVKLDPSRYSYIHILAAIIIYGLVVVNGNKLTIRASR